MRRAAWVLAIVSTVAFASAAAAQAPSSRHHHSYRHRGVGVSYAPSAHGIPHGRGTHFAALVGDPGGGLGFYALPTPYRVGALRYRLRNRPGPWDDPVRFAVMADAVRYPGWSTPDREYRYGVFNPYDGVGTPFFAGWYGPAGDDDDDSGFPFGHPYR